MTQQEKLISTFRVLPANKRGDTIMAWLKELIGSC
jgi:hypothetical protein